MKIVYTILLPTAILLSACAHLNRDYSSDTVVSTATTDVGLEVEQSWQTASDSSAIPTGGEAWFTAFNDPKLNQYIATALRGNRSLQAEASSLASTIEALTALSAQRKPSIDGRLRQNYTKADSSEGQFIYNTSLNLSWELDIWSRLSDQNKAGALTAEASAFTYEAARLSLAGNIAKRWFSIIASHLQLQINQKRLENQENALAIVEEQYKSGRGDAMDIFLGRSDVTSQRAAIVSTRNQLEQSIRTFKRLLGDYPDINLDIEASLPELSSNIPTGLPSDLLKRRPDVLASMKYWQASVLEETIADKARFPSFALTASYGASSEELLKISASDFIFNAINNITVPIFNGGQLKSELKQAEYDTEESYQDYVDTLLTSFEEVESALGAEIYLKEQLALLEQAESFAQSAYELAFEQYQSGLIRYSNLLEFERRWFTTQVDIITLKNSRLENRINLHLALGGDF